MFSKLESDSKENNSSTIVGNDETNNGDLKIANKASEELIQNEEKKDLQKFPLYKVITMFICYCVMLTISVLKGTDHIKSVIEIQT